MRNIKPTRFAEATRPKARRAKGVAAAASVNAGKKAVDRTKCGETEKRRLMEQRFVF